MEIVEYQDEAGGSAFAKWFDSLDLQHLEHLKEE